MCNFHMNHLIMYTRLINMLESNSLQSIIIFSLTHTSSHSACILLNYVGEYM